MAPLTKKLRDLGVRETIIHTGQHYDESMNNIFFKEMEIPKPDIQLECRFSLHGEMTAFLLEKLEKTFIELKPDYLFVYGDTNSTLAASLAAVKLHIPIAHIESGPRIYDLKTPEEMNRIVADHSAALRFCPDLDSVKNLAKENITDGVYLVGDLMYDAFLVYTEKSRLNERNLLERIGNRKFALLTMHRPLNVDYPDTLRAIVHAIKESPIDIVFPIHPRTRAALDRFGLISEIEKIPHLITLPPLGYLDIVALINNADVVLTDSGGLQKEAFWAGKPTVLLFHTTPWPAIMNAGWQKKCFTSNELDPKLMIDLLENFRPVGSIPKLFGSGDAAEQIVSVLISKGWI